MRTYEVNDVRKLLFGPDDKKYLVSGPESHYVLRHFPESDRERVSADSPGIIRRNVTDAYMLTNFVVVQSLHRFFSYYLPHIDKHDAIASDSAPICDPLTPFTGKPRMLMTRSPRTGDRVYGTSDQTRTWLEAARCFDDYSGTNPKFDFCFNQDWLLIARRYGFDQQVRSAVVRVNLTDLSIWRYLSSVPRTAILDHVPVTDGFVEVCPHRKYKLFRLSDGEVIDWDVPEGLLLDIKDDLVLSKDYRTNTVSLRRGTGAGETYKLFPGGTRGGVISPDGLTFWVWNHKQLIQMDVDV